MALKCGMFRCALRRGVGSGKLFKKPRDKRRPRVSRDLFHTLLVEKKYFPPEIHDWRPAGGTIQNNHADRGGEKYLRQLPAVRTFDIERGYHCCSAASPAAGR